MDMKEVLIQSSCVVNKGQLLKNQLLKEEIYDFIDESQHNKYN